MTISIAEWRYKMRNEISSISDTADIEINAILCKVLGKDLAWCLTHSEEELSELDLVMLNQQIEILRKGIPLPYIIGEIEFFGHHFFVDSNVLIPRPETEILVENAIEWISSHRDITKIVDIGTGSGAIVLSVLNEFPFLNGLGIDLTRSALEIAKKNRNNFSIKNLDFLQMDSLNGLASNFDVILANLPYIPESEVHKLDVVKYEPLIALNGGEKGIEIISRLIEQIPDHLSLPGLVLLEIQFDQSSVIKEVISKTLNNANVSVIKDYAGLDRVIKIEVNHA